MRCHRTFGLKGTVLNDLVRGRDQDPEWATCIGTRCPLWVPEVTVGGLVGVRARMVLMVTDEGETTGRGVCADNLGATPYVPYTSSVPRVVAGREPGAGEAEEDPARLPEGGA